MSDESPSPREQFRKLRMTLLFGVGWFSAVTAVLTTLGTVPMMPEEPWVGNVHAGMSLSAAVVAWLWARPRVPRRRSITSVDDFWRAPGTLNAALLPLVLLEASAILAILGAMLSGVGPTTAAAAPAILGMLTFSPSWIEQRMA